ncbi:MAG: four helix bundle protein [Candidatus Omnitrophota bacterium]
MEEKIRTFKDLKVWQKGMALTKEIYKTTKLFPLDERYGLSSQMRRAAVSIPSNIAEGFRRRYAKEHKQFLILALGSCAELETQLEISKELGYLDKETLLPIADLVDHICAMIVNMSKKIQ